MAAGLNRLGSPHGYRPLWSNAHTVSIIFSPAKIIFSLGGIWVSVFCFCKSPDLSRVKWRFWHQPFKCGKAGEEATISLLSLQGLTFLLGRKVVIWNTVVFERLPCPKPSLLPRSPGVKNYAMRNSFFWVKERKFFSFTTSLKINTPEGMFSVNSLTCYVYGFWVEQGSDDQLSASKPSLKWLFAFILKLNSAMKLSIMNETS